MVLCFLTDFAFSTKLGIYLAFHFRHFIIFPQNRASLLSSKWSCGHHCKLYGYYADPFDYCQRTGHFSDLEFSWAKYKTNLGRSADAGEIARGFSNLEDTGCCGGCPDLWRWAGLKESRHLEVSLHCNGLAQQSTRVYWCEILLILHAAAAGRGLSSPNGLENLNQDCC